MIRQYYGIVKALGKIHALTQSEGYVASVENSIY